MLENGVQIGIMAGERNEWKIMKKILIVEDDSDLRTGLAFALRSDGYAIDAVSTKRSALMQVQADTYAALVLDCRLPDGNGFDLSREIRGFSDVPILMLTAMDTEIDEINALENGADDYMSKPFSVAVLKLRLKKLMCRQERGMISSHGVTADLSACTVRKQGEEINLTSVEYKLLVYLMQHSGQVLSKTQILEHIWDINGQFVDENIVSVNIRRLRLKLEDDPSNPQVIKTVHGIGYVWREPE